MNMLIAYILFSMSGLILMKLGSGQIAIAINNGVLQFSLGIKVLFALIMYIISFLIWSQIVAKSDLAYIVPISSAIVNILSIIVGLLIFKESISIQQGIGIVVTIVGVILMNVK